MHMRTSAAAILGCLLTTPAWALGGAIDWRSDLMPCQGISGGLPGPIVSDFPGYSSCNAAGSPNGHESICRGQGVHSGDPVGLWVNNMPITVLGVDIMCVVPAGVACIAELGQAGGDGPDVLAVVAGTGPTNTPGTLLPYPVSIPANTGHFDVYAACDTWNQSMFVHVDITYEETPQQLPIATLGQPTS